MDEIPVLPEDAGRGPYEVVTLFVKDEDRELRVGEITAEPLEEVTDPAGVEIEDDTVGGITVVDLDPIEDAEGVEELAGIDDSVLVAVVDLAMVSYGCHPAKVFSLPGICYGCCSGTC